jgi:hypothetical protein
MAKHPLLQLLGVLLLALVLMLKQAQVNGDLQSAPPKGRYPCSILGTTLPEA